MERQFNNGDFERLLKENAGQYRMYPSEKVWKGIHTALHSRRRWYGITALAMLLVTGVIISIFVLNSKPEPGKEVVNNIPQKLSQLNNTSSVQNKQVPVRNFSPANPVISEENLIRTPDQGFILSPVAVNNENRIFPVVSSTPAEKSVPVSITAENTEASLISQEKIFASANILADNKSSDSQESAVKSNTDQGISINAEQPKEPVNTETSVSAKTDKISEAVMAIASKDAPVKTSKKQARLTAQVYFTPTISYRKLTENKKSAANPYVYAPNININKVVEHKPAMGLEFGLETRLRLNSKFSIKSGFQFNINRYDIGAYYHPTEIATVTLNNGPFGTDSLATLSNYRNSSSNSPNWLENFYFQVALPVGAEIILADNKKFSWGISGTIQPTYVIGDKAYLISSDYKNYAKFPDLMRRWNLSTGFETFISYSTGKLRWQVGPHVRYQHFSSFKNSVPVKENLINYGLKVGATLNRKK